MKRACPVSVALGDIRHVLKRLLAQLALVRVFSRPEELRADACQHFEFCIGCTRSAGRYSEGTGSVFLIQVIEYRCRIPVHFDIGIILCHGKRFHLKHDDVRMLFAVVFPGKQSVRTFFRLLLEDVGDQLFRITFRS